MSLLSKKNLNSCSMMTYKEEKYSVQEVETVV